MWSGASLYALSREVDLKRGPHTLEVFGADACCDGARDWRFMVHGVDWKE